MSRLDTPSIQFSFLTLFPEVMHPFLNSSLMGKAAERGILAWNTLQIRDFAEDRHRTVDDTPYGGGAGMVMRADVLHRAWKAAGGDGEPRPKTILLSPQGKLFDQALAQTWSREKHLIFVCGHYEGVDERFIDECVDEEVSIGNFVLTGGELPALVLADAISRWIPGVVGKEESVSEDSLQGGLLKYPQYTRPRVFEGREVPEILLSGDHGKIKAWRDGERRDRTRRKRPDLLKK